MFNDISEGDYVKFKKIKTDDFFKENIYHGIVLEISRTGYIGIRIDENDKTNDYPLGLTIYIDKRQILQVYSHKLVNHLTPRLSLKNIWKDFIFREVKVTKCNNLLYSEYRYIGKTGFEKIKRFKDMNTAYSNISTEYHHNIIPCYEEYFGFTNDKAIRNNDHYYDREIFFSKKCYCELDFSQNPTADFMTSERGFNPEPPLTDSLICGIVENGEKGLFYRKWFICSYEFLTLWTMVCQPNDASLCEPTVSEINEENWKEYNKKVKRKVKDLDKLIKELDTNHYSVNLKLELKERKKKYFSYNLERAALYFPNRYKQIAKILFRNNMLKSEESYSEDTEKIDKYTSFQKRFLKNIMWPKKIKI